jgi:hypothetical protein
MKRGLHGTYISVEPFHLLRTSTNRPTASTTVKKMNDYDRFKLALSQVTGKRLTYEHLTGKDREEQPPQWSSEAPKPRKESTSSALKSGFRLRNKVVMSVCRPGPEYPLLRR